MPCVARGHERINHYGIEVADGVMWQGWEPGREYTKNVTLKNVRVKTQKLKYKVPSSRFFTTLYPKPIVLSAGTSFTLPITFRPLEKDIYEDKIEFLTNEGKFSLPMRAVLPRVEVAAPEHINFNMCATQDSVQLTFEIRNVSELKTPFQVDCQAPFVIAPTDGTLEPFSTFKLHATFKPTAAVVYEAEAVIKYGENYDNVKVMKLEGIGKFPHLLVPTCGRVPSGMARGLEAIINFDEVVVGQMSEKWIELKNLSPVNAPYLVEHPTGLSRIDTVFQCLQKEGVVPANSSIKIPIVFCPNTVGTKSIDYFHIKPIGNISKTVVKCVGESAGPQLHLSHTALNFLQVDAGSCTTRTLDLVNDSNAEADFQFMLDCDESVFKFEETSGILGPRSKHTLIVSFQPTHPINYYRRVACVVHNQLPLFIDLLGTCHTETSKPAVLQTSHIDQYRTHVERGFSFLPPEHLNEMVHDGKLKVDDQGTLINAQDDGGGPTIQPPALFPMDEYFNDGYHTEITNCPPHCSLDIHEADFGRCPDMRIIQRMNVNLTNHTKGKITIVWMGGPNHVFSVSPAAVDVAPLSSTSFTVTFKPTAPNQFYGCELEGYAYYKSLRDYRLVESTTHCPPWAVTLCATGHTFTPNSETFLPRFMLDSHKVVFPAVNANEATYRTVLLCNTGTTPILYDFKHDETGVFHMKPTKGLLRNGHQLFVIKIQPKAVQTCKNTLCLKLNDADKNNQEIIAWGSAESAEVNLENDGVMYFQPTCIGTASTRQYAVKNVSRIPLKFEWKMNHADANLLTVVPSTGVIHPNESQLQTWSFKPSSEKKFVMKPALVVWGQGQSSVTSGGKKRQFLVRGIGEGTLGEIKAEQNYFDYGTIIVGSSASQHITLHNPSSCSLYYQLHVQQTASHDGPSVSDNTEPAHMALELEVMSGMLPARSKQIIRATVRPQRRLYYQFCISYTLITPEDSEPLPSSSSPQQLCHILATGVFPTLSVTDARCYGSAKNISKKQLWSLFSLDGLNLSMDADPAVSELMFSAKTRQSHQRRPPVFTRAVVDFNFGAAPIGSEPCVVQLMLENSGAVATEWAFMFPNELHLELDYWAETGEFDEDELHEMKVMDNHLFSVEPSRGQLQPGECKRVSLQYCHVMPGTDRLPVLMKIADGREILLNFIGVTVEPERRYIHFPSNKFQFSPVAIGDQNSPKQIYEMYNGGALPVKYEFNLAPLDILNRENYDHPIFEVTNPMGEILPGHTANIEWKFSPLEATTYVVDIPIRIHNGDTALVMFTGVGYDKRVLGDTMPLSDEVSAACVPAIQSAPIPGQLCYLSQERLAFGNLALFSRARRIVTMLNQSSQHPVAYQWHVTAKGDTQFVSISPSHGILQPHESALCKISFTARGKPSFFDLDLVCEVFNLSEHTEYKRQLVAWEKERQRQKVEFTVTEDDLDADMRLEDEESNAGSRPPSGRLKSLEKRPRDSPDADLAKYRTLPPIKQRSIDQERSLEKDQHQFDTLHWECPQPPRPFLLHLGITARTHNVSDFQVNFPEQYKEFFIDRTLSQVQPELGLTMEENIEKTVCVESEGDVVAGALQNILRGLLDDSGFIEAIKSVGDEDTPYFHQFTNKPALVSAPSITIQEQASEREETARSKPSSSAGTKRSRKQKTPSRAASQASVAEKSDAGSVKSTRSSKKADGDTPTSERCSPKSGQGSGQGSPKAMTPHSKVVTPDREVADTGSPREEELERLMDTARDQVDILTLDDIPTAGSQADEPPFEPTTGTDFAQKQHTKKSPEFGSMVESVLENTVLNIIQEAFHQEFNITARPRLVALLPRAPSGMRSHVSQKQCHEK